MRRLDNARGAYSNKKCNEDYKEHMRRKKLMRKVKTKKQKQGSGHKRRQKRDKRRPDEHGGHGGHGGGQHNEHYGEDEGRGGIWDGQQQQQQQQQQPAQRGGGGYQDEEGAPQFMQYSVPELMAQERMQGNGGVTGAARTVAPISRSFPPGAVGRLEGRMGAGVGAGWMGLGARCILV